LPVIVSGGITDYDDLKMMKEISPYGVVIGKAIYEGKMDINVIAK